jgi:hypothetical protein
MASRLLLHNCSYKENFVRLWTLMTLALITFSSCITFADDVEVSFGAAESTSGYELIVTSDNGVWTHKIKENPAKPNLPAFALCLETALKNGGFSWDELANLGKAIGSGSTQSLTAFARSSLYRGISKFVPMTYDATYKVKRSPTRGVMDYRLRVTGREGVWTQYFSQDPVDINMYIFAEQLEQALNFGSVDAGELGDLAKVLRDDTLDGRWLNKAIKSTVFKRVIQQKLRFAKATYEKTDSGYLIRLVGPQGYWEANFKINSPKLNLLVFAQEMSFALYHNRISMKDVRAFGDMASSLDENNLAEFLDSSFYRKVMKNCRRVTSRRTRTSI